MLMLFVILYKLNPSYCTLRLRLTYNFSIQLQSSPKYMGCTSTTVSVTDTLSHSSV